VEKLKAGRLGSQEAGRLRVWEAVKRRNGEAERLSTWEAYHADKSYHSG
jgi:hypothetical protein